MNKNTPIVIIGFGSIGRRHEKNLRELGFVNLAVYDTDLGKITEFQGEKLAVLDEKTLSRFKIAFITNPTHQHISAATLAAKAGCHLFIEKPVSHTLAGVEELRKICAEKKLVNMVACNMRFFPAYAFMNGFLEQGSLGKVHRIHLSFDYYLPYWRPDSDYTKSYSAKKEWGGGIVLDDIHEFDLLFWLMKGSEVSSHKIFRNRSGALPIEVEDQAFGVFEFEGGVLGSVSCGYLSKRYHREARIVGEAGTLSWSIGENKVYLETKERRDVLFSGKESDLDGMYKKELAYFLKQVERGESTFNDVAEAGTLLKYILE